MRTTTFCVHPESYLKYSISPLSNDIIIVVCLYCRLPVDSVALYGRLG